MEIMCLPVCNQNYLTTKVTIPLVTYILICMILFKSQLLIKLF